MDHDKEITKNEIVSYISNWLNDTLPKHENLFSNKPHTPTVHHVDEYIQNNTFYTSNIEYLEFTIEPSSSGKINSPIKVNLINNMEYEDDRAFSGPDLDMLRIFTLESDNQLKFFTAEGSRNHFISEYNATPQEHSKEDFLKLLNEHKNLKDNNFAKYMQSVILHNELQDNLSEKKVKKNKPKI